MKSLTKQGDCVRLYKLIKVLRQGGRISLVDYCRALKLSRYTLREAEERILILTYKEDVENPGDQLRVLREVYATFKTGTTRRERMCGIKHHTPVEWETKKILSGNCCAYCHKPTDKLTKDHIVPISAGGSDTIDNIAPACWLCNHSKFTKSAAKFLKEVTNGQ